MNSAVQRFEVIALSMKWFTELITSTIFNTTALR